MPPPAKRRKTLAEQIAEFNDTTPKDFDPADLDFNADRRAHSDSEESEDDNDGREHYEAVGKSKLRKPAAVPLGPHYAGAKVSRTAWNEDEDDDPFARGFSEEEDSDEGLVERQRVPNGSRAMKGLAESDNESSPGSDSDSIVGSGIREDGEESLSEAFEESMESDESEPGLKNGTTTANIDIPFVAKLALAPPPTTPTNDVAKGRAILRQRAAFDALLGVRMKLQKALISANTLCTLSTDCLSSDDTSSALAQAESTAAELFNSLTSQRIAALQSKTHAEITIPQPLSKVDTRRRDIGQTKDVESTCTHHDAWKMLQDLETCTRSRVETTLDSWAAKTEATIGKARFREQNTKVTVRGGDQKQKLSQTIHGMLEAEEERWIARTTVPRSCAPVQAQRLREERKNNSNTAAHAAEIKEADDRANDDHHAHDVDDQAARLPIYDDADFYSMLLQALIAQRGASLTTTAGGVSFPAQAELNAAREARTKKVVDTKASKGRKMRYTVHEKLMNFMAPEDRGSWGERQCDELFGGLFGRRVGEVDVMESGIVEEGDVGELRLFAGA